VEAAAGNPADVKIPGIEEDVASATESAEETMISMEPGLVQFVRPGEKITQIQPSDVSGSWEPWAMMELRGIAKGMGLTYEMLTGDLRGVNFSSIRQGIIGFRRKCRRLQVGILVHQYCRPVAARWLDMAVLAGRIKIRDYTANRARYIHTAWDADGWEWVDPSKDVGAEKDAIRSGLKTLPQSVGERGRDIDEIMAEIAETNKKADAAGIVLDTDPRALSVSGVKHQTPTAAKPVTED
jgi:lambda family phage portal protein